MRIAKIDNAKGLLITLVVFGHLLEMFLGWGNADARPFLYWIYSFHMPLFVILCGLTFSNKDVVKKVVFVFSIFLIFQVIYALPDSIKSGNYMRNILTPYWILWFLVSLASWMILYRIFGEHKYSVLLSIGISLCGGLIPFDGSYFSYMRTLTFMPFFFIGVKLKSVDLSFFNKSSSAFAVAFLIFSVSFACLLMYFNISNRFLFGSYGYQGSGYRFLYAVIIKLSMIAMPLMISIMLFMAMPDRNTFLSKLGVSSLSIYVLHGLVLWGVDSISSDINLSINKYLYITFLLILAFFISKVLSIRCIDSLIRYVGTNVSSAIYSTVLRKPLV